jgi:hypothetical protein
MSVAGVKGNRVTLRLLERAQQGMSLARALSVQSTLTQLVLRCDLVMYEYRTYTYINVDTARAEL